jgi:hypothetical protein
MMIFTTSVTVREVQDHWVINLFVSAELGRESLLSSFALPERQPHEVMVWQDFMFGCGQVPYSFEYLK